MAKGLNAKAPPSNVTKLPTRAARGAGKSKPTEPKVKLKPSIPADRKPAPTEENLRESLQLQIVGYTQQHRQVDAEIDVLKGELKLLTDRKKQIRGAIQTAGMPLALFDEAYDDAATSRVDLERKENLRAIVREALGLSTPQQADFLKGIPSAAAPGVYWEAEGYKDGINGKFAKPPESCPPENHQDYLRGHANAMEINARGIKAVKDAPATPAPAAAAPEGEEDDTSDRDEDDDAGGLEKGLEEGGEPIDRPAATDAPSAPELDGAPETEPAVARSAEVLH